MVSDGPLADALSAPWTAADRALLDEARELVDGPPSEVYGHIVIDEAQELTEMDWRAVLCAAARAGR